MGPQSPQDHKKDNTNLWILPLGTSLEQRPKKLIYGPISPQAYNKGPNMYTAHKANEAYYKGLTVRPMNAPMEQLKTNMV